MATRSDNTEGLSEKTALKQKQPDAQKGTPASDFVSRVRARDAIKLGEARAYAATLPHDTTHPSGCHRVYCRQGACCCPNRCVGYARPMRCSCCPCCSQCLWTPACFGCDLGIGLCFCVQSDASPGTYSCTDLKGNFYALVRVDEKRGTLAWFSDNVVLKDNMDDTTVSCYCIP